MLSVRPATVDDLAAILDMYNASILTTSTWADVPQTMPEREAWFAESEQVGDHVVVAEEDGAVIGFAAYGEFRDNTL